MMKVEGIEEEKKTGKKWKTNTAICLLIIFELCLLNDKYTVRLRNSSCTNIKFTDIQFLGDIFNLNYRNL